MKKSRRQFLKLVAAGSAAAITGATHRSVAAAAVKTAARRAARLPSTASPSGVAPAGSVRAEIAKQRAQAAKSLKAIRDYPLPTGSPMALMFKPMRPQRGRKAR